MKNTFLVTCICAGLALLPAPVHAAWWADNFNAHSPTDLAPQFGWETWDGNPSVGNAGVISAPQFPDRLNFVNLNWDSDVVHRFTSLNGSRYVMHASWYTGTNPNNSAYLILLNRYNPPFTYNWSLQIGRGGNIAWWESAGVLQNVAGNPALPIGGGPGTLSVTPGTWAEVVVNIDLANNDVETYINGQLLAKHPWKSDASSVAAIAAVDLFATPNGPFYQEVHFDDLCILEDKPTVLRRGLWDNFSATPANGGYETAKKGNDLLAAFPASPWKNFDDPTGDKHFGLTWQLPTCHFIKGHYVARLQPSAFGSANDVMYLGLNPPALQPPLMAWAQAFASMPGTFGTWNSGDPARTLDFDLTNMPVGVGSPAGLNMLPMLNDRTTYTGDFDMLFQDDTKIDYAELRLWACCPKFNGISADTIGHANLQENLAGNLLVSISGPDSGVSLKTGDASSGAVRIKDSAAFNAIGVVTHLIGKCLTDCCKVTMVGLGSQTRLDYDFSEVGATSVTITETSPTGAVLVNTSGPGVGSYIPIQPSCGGDFVFRGVFDETLQRWIYKKVCGIHPSESWAFSFPAVMNPLPHVTQVDVETTGLQELEIVNVGVGGNTEDGGGTGDPYGRALGEASLTAYDGRLLAYDIGSTGNDGVRIEAGLASEIGYALHSFGGGITTVPAGTVMTSRTLGVRNGVSGQLLNVTRYVHDGSGSYEIIPNFEAIGATTYEARFYRDGLLLASETRPNNQRVAICVGKGDNKDEKDKGGKPGNPRGTSLKRIGFFEDTNVITNGGALVVDAIEIETETAIGVSIGGLEAIEVTSNGITEMTLGSLRSMHRVSGRVILGDFGQPTGQTVTVEVRAPGSTTPLESHSVVLGEDAECEFETAYCGPVDIAIQGSHWLRKRMSTFVSSGGLAGWVVTLTNGDVDRDNEVAIGDYARLSLSYNTSLGDVDFDADADLNGDDTVDIGDYAILSGRYGTVGDE